MFMLIEPTWRHSLEHLAWAHQLGKESRKMQTSIEKYIFLRGKRFKLGIWFSGIQAVQHSQVLESISTNTHTHTPSIKTKKKSRKIFQLKKVIIKYTYVFATKYFVKSWWGEGKITYKRVCIPMNNHDRAATRGSQPS